MLKAQPQFALAAGSRGPQGPFAVQFLLMTSHPPRTAVYIDRFNLYYSIRYTPNK